MKYEMTAELQNKAWSVLPKEFKEEVKKEYRKGYECETLAMLITLFSHDNLTSDAEGEEMLTCEKSDVQGLYQEALELIDRGERNNYLNDKLVGIGQKDVLYALFGSACLPDETREKREKRQIKRELNEDNFAKSDAPSTGGKEVNFTSKAQPGTDCNGYDDRRLHIAAQILTALYANELYTQNRYMEQLVETALKATDLLIAECGKGGKDGE